MSQIIAIGDTQRVIPQGLTVLSMRELAVSKKSKTQQQAGIDTHAWGMCLAPTGLRHEPHQQEKKANCGNIGKTVCRGLFAYLDDSDHRDKGSQEP